MTGGGGGQFVLATAAQDIVHNFVHHLRVFSLAFLSLFGAFLRDIQ
jgi:hypothetical protein